MSSRSAAVAGGVAVIALVGVVSVLVLGEDGEQRPGITTTARPGDETANGGGANGESGPTDRASGAGRSGGTERASGATNANGATRRSATTRDDGASGSGTDRSSTSPARTHGGQSRRATDAAPAGGVQVSFQCTDDVEQRLSGVWIEVRRRSGAPAGHLTSDGEGTAHLGALPAGEAIEGVARHPLSKESVAFGPITIKSGSVVKLKFRRAATGVLTGRVVDERGQGVTRARLRLIDPKQAGEAVLDGLGMGLGPDGTFRATVAAGAYTLSAEADGFAPSDRTYVTVSAGGEAGPVELLMHTQGRIAGTVTLPGDLLAALPAKLDLVVEVTRGTVENPYQRLERKPLEIDATRRFEVTGCDPGRYRVRLEAPAAGGNRVGEWHAFTLDPGQDIDGIELVLRETAAAVRGVVRDDQSLPVEGVKVSVRGRESITDRDGRYAIHGLDPGEDILVEARAERFAPATQQATYEGAELVIDLVLERLGGVRGTVRATGGLRGSVPVLVCQQVDGGVRPYQVAAGADGVYLLEALPPGTYFIKAGPGADPFDASGAPTVEVRPGEVVVAPDVVVP